MNIAENLPYLSHFGTVVSTISTFFLGTSLIKFLRDLCAKSNNRSQFSWVPIISPMIAFFILNTLAYFEYFSQIFADFSTLGYILGILLGLSQKSNITKVRLIVQQVNGESPIELIVDNTDITIRDAKDMISKALNIAVGTVSIESGKGTYLDDDGSLLPAISVDTSNTDLFGFNTARCYINIEDDDPSDAGNIDIDDDDDEDEHKKLLPNLTRMLPGHRPHIKYGADITLYGKIANAANDSNSFEINEVEGYGAASLAVSQPGLAYMQEQARALMPGMQHTTAAHVTFVAWREDVADDKSMASGRSTLFNKAETSQSGQNIGNGDAIVLGTDGKFMTVVRGWWIAWASSTPRRSGAFRVEIVEKAAINTMQQSLHAVKGMISRTTDKEKDSHLLRAGDVFRLRSVKFPDYELGITGKTLKDNCYNLGLRKIDNSVTSANSSDNWCMPLRFTAKNINMM